MAIRSSDPPTSIRNSTLSLILKAQTKVMSKAPASRRGVGADAQSFHNVALAHAKARCGLGLCSKLILCSEATKTEFSLDEEGCAPRLKICQYDMSLWSSEFEGPRCTSPNCSKILIPILHQAKPRPRCVSSTCGSGTSSNLEKQNGGEWFH